MKKCDGRNSHIISKLQIKETKSIKLLYDATPNTHVALRWIRCNIIVDCERGEVGAWEHGAFGKTQRYKSASTWPVLSRSLHNMDMILLPYLAVRATTLQYGSVGGNRLHAPADCKPLEACRHPFAASQTAVKFVMYQRDIELQSPRPMDSADQTTALTTHRVPIISKLCVPSIRYRVV